MSFVKDMGPGEMGLCGCSKRDESLHLGVVLDEEMADAAEEQGEVLTAISILERVGVGDSI